MPESSALRQAIEAAACICGQRDEALTLPKPGEADRVIYRLKSRLRAYESASGANKPVFYDDLERQTGDVALDALDAVHIALLEQHDSTSNSQSSNIDRPKLGSRDIKILQILLSIISNWKLGILISAFDTSLSVLQSATFSQRTPAKLEELPDEISLSRSKKAAIGAFSKVCSESSDALKRFENLLAIGQTQSPISDLVLHSCAPQIVALAIRIAWGPVIPNGNERRKRQREETTTFVGTLLRSLSTSSCLKILSASGHTRVSTKATSDIPLFVKAATECLYSAQLLRTDAVMALLKHVFGNEEQHGSDLMKKLAGIGHLLSTPPPNLSLDAFAKMLVPRLMDIVSELPSCSQQEQQRSPSRLSTSTHKTAACFALARLHEVAPEAMKRSAHDLLWKFIAPEQRQDIFDFDQVHASVQLLYHLVEYSEPSTTFLSSLISPVVIPLFTLCSFLKYSKSESIIEMDPKGKSPSSSLVSMATSLLQTWLRLVDVEEGCRVLSPMNKASLFATSGNSVGPVDHTDGEEQPYWNSENGQITLSWEKDEQAKDISSALSSMQVQDLQTLLTSNSEANIPSPSFLSALSLAPSPTLLSSLLKESSRKDIALQLMSDLLECYSLAKQSKKTLSNGTQTSSDSFLYVQHILEFINVFDSETVSGQAGKILSFVNFALGTNVGSQFEDKGQKSDDIPFIHAQELGSLAGLTDIGWKSQETSNTVSQDEEEPDNELVETAINLLLSLLEGSPETSAESHSLLKLISAKLEWHIAVSNNGEIRSLAKEARLVITARDLKVVSSDDYGSTGTPIQRAYAKGNETYQEALRLLQDPILPVRAHGLVLLKELAACGSSDLSQPRLMDPALTSAIVDIYIQAIQDDESFLYLNAVKGIAELANTGGKAMIKRLVGLYLGINFTKEQVDMQLRMGEALLQVIQRLEEALSAHIDEIVHPLLTALRQAIRPTTLRSSYLSILGTCVEACPEAFSATQIGSTLIDAMLDLLSVETSQSKQCVEDTQDPTVLDTKLPQLRRGAILLVSLLIRGSRHQLQLAQEKKDDVLAQQEFTLTSLRMPNGGILQADNSGIDRSHARPRLMFPEDRTKRTKVVLGFIAQTDGDNLVRHQSQELLHELDLLTLSHIA